MTFSSPPFEVLDVWLESLAMHISVGHRLPNDLTFDIDHYKGSQSRESSLSSTPDGLSTPPACKTPRLRSAAAPPCDVTSDSTAEANVDSTRCCTDDTSEIAETVVKPHEVDAAAAIADEPIEQQQTNAFIRDIPKSPHLSKDFSPNGDRIRDSVRARRQQRMQQIRENHRKSYDNNPKSDETASLSSATTIVGGGGMEKSLSEPINLVTTTAASSSSPSVHVETAEILKAVKQTLELEHRNLNNLSAPPDRSLRKSRPYGEKGFIINVNNNGLLTLNNVKDLDNCSDFDSSCDTSLNYIDVNGLPPPLPLPPTLMPEPAVETPAIAEKLLQQTNVMPAQPQPEPSSQMLSKSYKSALEELKSKLNICRNKLESLETAGKQTISNSRRSMRNYFKSTPLGNRSAAIDCTDGGSTAAVPVVPSMYSRTNPMSSSPTDMMNGGSAETPKPKSTSTKLFRISDTPIFERRNVRSMFGAGAGTGAVSATAQLFRRSDSNENIPATPKTTNAYKSYEDRSSPQERSFSFKQRISPTSTEPRKVSAFNCTTSTINDGPTTKSNTTTSISPIKQRSFVFGSNTNSSLATIKSTNLPTTTTYTSTGRHYLKGTSASAQQQQPSNNHHCGNYTRNYSQLHHHRAEKPSTMEHSGQATAAAAVSASAVNKAKPSVNTSKVTTRINLLSPERIHRLNAKLTESKNNGNGCNSSNSFSSSSGAGANNRSNGMMVVTSAPQHRVHLKPATASKSNGSTSTSSSSSQYQQNMLVHKFTDSPVRRTVSKFDRKSSAVPTSRNSLMDAAL